MKVALDISRLHNLSLDRGIGVYAKNLYEALKKYTNIDVDLVKEKTDYTKYNLIHQPFFDFYRRTLLDVPNVPLVVTIHDVIPIMFKQHYPAGIKGKINWHFQKNNLKKVKAVIAVSETVKKDIHQELNISEDKIFSVYLSVADNFKVLKNESELFKIKTKFDLPDEFVLYVGNVNWNKNILNITKGVLDADKKLVIIGGAFKNESNLNHPEKKLFKEWVEKYKNNQNVILTGSVSAEEITGIMNLAKCLIFVSYYEGFGLPILEAQKCGLPVITSNVSATKEISGKGAILVSPESVDEISGAIVRIFKSGDLRKELIKKGFENVEKFSWEKTAKETVKVYERILK